MELGHGVVAEVEGDKLGERVKDLVGELVAGDVIARDVEEQEVVQAGEEVGGEEGEGVVLDEDLLQVGALLEDGGRQGGEVVVRSRWASDQTLEREVRESTER